MYHFECIAVLTIAIMATLPTSESAEKRIVCFFNNAALTLPWDGKMDINDIDPTLCTHIIYGFAVPTADGGLKSRNSWIDFPYGLDGYRKLNALRKSNPNLKTLLCVIDSNIGNNFLGKVAANNSLRNYFVNNLFNYVKTHEFDGADIAWLFPNHANKSPEEKNNFLLLLESLKERFSEANLLLSATLGPTKSRVETSYLVPNISQYLDFMNLMTYDLHVHADQKTGINAPLKAGSWETGDERDNNVESIINQWKNYGIPLEKLNLGIATYGHTFTLKDPSDRQIGAPVDGPGEAGIYTEEPGSLGYNEICEMKMENKRNWEEHFQEEQRVPYAIIRNQWIGYDNPKSVAEKAKFSLEQGLGGVSVYSIMTDDFKGTCGEKYPLLTAIKNALDNDALVPTSSEMPIAA